MRSDTWFGKFWNRLAAGIIDDVPPSLEACEACREVDCTQARWRSCAVRLAAEAERLMPLGPAFHPTARTDEMHGVSSIELPGMGSGGAESSGEGGGNNVVDLDKQRRSMSS